MLSWRLLLVVLAAAAVAAVGLVANHAQASGGTQAGPSRSVVIPHVSPRLRAAIIRESKRLYGLDAPAARFAAQIHQESRWNANAASKFANGLAQFTPPTADWIADAYPELRPAAPWNPEWSIRAMVRYMHHIESRQAPAATPCDAWAFALSGYNGGPGWVVRDRRVAHQARASPDRWFGHVELHTTRAGWARRENRDYVRRILLIIEPEYIAAGWPGSPACPSESAEAAIGVS